MNALNSIIIEGNVVRKPTLRETPNGKKVSILPIAVNHFYRDSAGKDVSEVGYYDVESWGDKFTERITKFSLQGRGVRVVGRLKQDRWKDENGKNHSKVYIVAEHVDFKPMKKKDAQSGENEVYEENSAADSTDEEGNLAAAREGLEKEAAVF